MLFMTAVTPVILPEAGSSLFATIAALTVPLTSLIAIAAGFMSILSLSSPGRAQADSIATYIIFMFTATLSTLAIFAVVNNIKDTDAWYKEVSVLLGNTVDEEVLRSHKLYEATDSGELQTGIKLGGIAYTLDGRVLQPESTDSNQIAQVSTLYLNAEPELRDQIREELDQIDAKQEN